MSIRIIFRTLTTFIGIIAIILILWVCWYEFFGLSGYYANSYYPEVFTFIDLDKDGRYDPGEPPLQGACIESVYGIDQLSDIVKPIFCYKEWKKTDINGLWKSDLISSPKSCKEIYVLAIPPKGYQATNTPVDHFCDPEFGFIKGDYPVIDETSSLELYALREHVLNALRVTSIWIFVLGTSVGSTLWINRRELSLN